MSDIGQIMAECDCQHSACWDRKYCMAAKVDALTAEKNEYWKSFVHWRKESDALTEQLEAVRADAKEAEAYAEELEKDRNHWQDVAGREGVCMTCRGPRGAPEPYGCSDCLNTGYCGEWHNEMGELREERERLALAICGGEDAPGYANAQTVETLEKVARDNANATMAQINRTLAAEAKLAKVVEALRKIHHAVCGETGFAACVRLDSGLAYPWPALDEADEMTRTTLAEIEGEQT